MDKSREKCEQRGGEEEGCVDRGRGLRARPHIVLLYRNRGTRYRTSKRTAAEGLLTSRAYVCARRV
jgi:hypothetical protein